MWHAIVIVIALWFVVAYTKSEAPPRPMHAKGESPQSMHRASDLHLLNLSESCDQAIPNKPCLLDLRPSMLHPAKVIGCFDLRPRMLLGPQTLHATSSQSHWMYVACCRNPTLLERQRERERERERQRGRERERERERVSDKSTLCFSCRH